MVSLIVPCYNGEKFINRCIDSILSQTDSDIELILVNDGSTDKTDEIVRSREKEIQQFVKKYIYIIQENQGVGAACNKAFKYATGQYLTLLDVDDYMMPESIKSRREWLDSHPDFGIVRTNGYYVQEGLFEVNERLFEINSVMKNKEYIFDDIFEGTTYLWPGSYMIRMKVLKELYPEKEIYPSRYGQNLQFLMMAAYKNKAGFIDVPLMKYTIRKESLSHFSSGDVLSKEIENMLEYKKIREHLIKEFMPKIEQRKWFERMEILYGKIFVQLCCKYGNREKALKYYTDLKVILKGKIDINTEIAYYKLISPAKYCMLRVLRKLKIRK